MCGLTGFYVCENRQSRAELHAIARKMAQAITHRGPDSGDIWQDPEEALALAHRRLSILDLSAEGAQPKASASGRFIIIYNGEIYNHLDLRRDLEGEGVIFKGRSDTETLLFAIEQWGLNRTLQKIVGMFAFVLWDRKERVLHFARDRLGKKPLYIGWAGKSLIFGSELKALRAHAGFEAEINKGALNHYLQYLCVSAPATIYENVWQLPPGCRLSVEVDALKARENLASHMQPFWDAGEQCALAGGKNGGSEAEVLQGFENLLEQAVRERMISDVPLGAFLSGGIDSSCVTAIMQKISAQPVKTFSIGFEEAGYDEAVYAKEIAAHLGCEHTEHYCSDRDALEVIPKLAEMYDEPFADQSAIPTYLVSKFAREHVTVALSGDGGDELLGGYTRHRQGAKAWRRMKYLPYPLRLAARAALKTGGGALVNGDAQKASHLAKFSHALGARDLQELYLSLVQQGCGVHEKGGQFPVKLPPLGAGSVEEQLMLWDTVFYLPGDVLTKVDRASMAVSLEVRAPLLDHRLFEYAWGLPLKYKIRDGKGKYLLREVLRKYVPSEMFERPKQGFNIPLAAWLRGPLREWAEDLLDESAMREQGLLDARAVRKVWGRYLKGDDRYANGLWAVLMFQAWYKKWV